ncbi:MAG: SGNH/GDSL hydrolase family protein [Verrucomicrobia bacterium]|nr:SGNH/GDSL hydrolase family protein [Verrucomicrobiota bacterium]
MRLAHLAIAFLGASFFLPPPSAAADAGHRAAGIRRMVFLGDSITYAGSYVDCVEAVLRLRDPAWRGEILALGLPSETMSGLSEPGHAGGKFPRPVLRERLDRVLEQTKPNLVVACYGMNDGIYHPFSDERFAAFAQGIAHLRDRVAAAHAQLIHVTPPVFDPDPIREKTLPAGLDAYPKYFAGYNDVLDRYSAWLIAQRASGWEVVDAHGPMNQALARLRAREPRFTFARDGVHPDAAGHVIIARAILVAWNLRPDDGELLGNLAAAPESELLKLIRSRRKLLSDAWLGATGHQRPGMAKGLPLAEAATQAAGLDEKIRALTSRSRN